MRIMQNLYTSVSFVGAQCYYLARCIIRSSNAWTGSGLSPRRLINTTVIGVRYLPTASTRCLSLWRGEFTSSLTAYISSIPSSYWVVFDNRKTDHPHIWGTDELLQKLPN